MHICMHASMYSIYSMYMQYGTVHTYMHACMYVCTGVSIIAVCRSVHLRIIGWATWITCASSDEWLQSRWHTTRLTVLQILPFHLHTTKTHQVQVQKLLCTLVTTAYTPAGQASLLVCVGWHQRRPTVRICLLHNKYIINHLSLGGGCRRYAVISPFNTTGSMCVQTHCV